jgi:hypothetical protein
MCQKRLELPSFKSIRIDSIFGITIGILIGLLSINLGLNIVLAVIVGCFMWYVTVKAIQFNREDLK